MKKIVQIMLCIIFLPEFDKQLKADEVLINQKIDTIQENKTTIQNDSTVIGDLTSKKLSSKDSYEERLKNLPMMPKTDKNKNKKEIASYPEHENIYDEQNLTPIYYTTEKIPLIAAVQKNDLITVKKLLQLSNTDRNIRDVKGKTAYDYAIEKSKGWINLPVTRRIALEISELVKPYNSETQNPDGSMKEID